MSYKSTILKIKGLTFIFFLVFAFGFTQNKEIDSLKAELLKPSLNDTIKISSYLSLAKEYMSFNIDSLSYYNDMALNLSLKNKDYLLQRVYSNKGLAFIYSSMADSARYYLDKSLSFIETSGDSILKPVVLGNYSMSYQIDNDIKNMGKYNLAAIKASEGNDEELSRLYYNQGIIFGHSDLMDEAKKYFKLSLYTSKKVENLKFESMSAKGLGHIYFTENKLDSSKIYLDRAIDICTKTNNPQICYESHSKIGELYDLLKKPKLAEFSFKKALAYAKIRNRPYELMAINIFLGQHELKEKNFVKARAYFESFDKIYKNSPEPTLRYEALRDWAKTEEIVGNFKKSNFLFQEYVKIKDSVYSIENRKVLADRDAKYQSEKKDKELAQQKLTLEQQETELQKKKKENGYITGAALVLLVASILLWFLYQQRQKRKNQEIITLKRERQVQTLESLMEGEEKERMRIAKELHDGVNVDLSAIKYKLTSLLEKNNEVINEAVLMIDKSCEQVRAISHNLIPPSLKNFSLIETLEDFCTTTNNLHKPTILFNHIGEPVHISKKAEINIFRIVQELVNNSVKHADATEITVQISHRNHSIQLTVEDNGVGFERENVENGGIGLKNIQSRVDYLQAKLDFSSNDKGTSYIIDINTDDLV